MTDAFSRLCASDRPIVMGILNVTPDSFSDGGLHRDPVAAIARARQMAAEGAAIIDIGGESTRPGHQPVTVEEERARVLPVVEALAQPAAALLSVDTTKAALAHAALCLGATIVNDQWGFQGDPAMAEVVAGAQGSAAVLMHNRAAIDPALAMADELLRFFERSLAIAARAGVPEHRLVLDPGIGFGKTPVQQLTALNALPALTRAFGLPLLVGVSRKSFLGRLTGSPVEHRLPDTVAANCFARGRGARLFRVHDVAAHVAALEVFAALEAAGSPERAS